MRAIRAALATHRAPRPAATEQQQRAAAAAVVPAAPVPAVRAEKRRETERRCSRPRNQCWRAFLAGAGLFTFFFLYGRRVATVRKMRRT
jgi:hypothetical protein